MKKGEYSLVGSFDSPGSALSKSPFCLNPWPFLLLLLFVGRFGFGVYNQSSTSLSPLLTTSSLLSELPTSLLSYTETRLLLLFCDLGTGMLPSAFLTIYRGNTECSKYAHALCNPNPCESQWFELRGWYHGNCCNFNASFRPRVISYNGSLRKGDAEYFWIDLWLITGGRFGSSSCCCCGWTTCPVVDDDTDGTVVLPPALLPITSSDSFPPRSWISEDISECCNDSSPPISEELARLELPARLSV